MYYDFIKHPMDLGKVMTQLKAGMYNADTDLFIADVRLVFRNCEIFNPRDHEANINAFKASEAFERAIRDPDNYAIHIKGGKSKSKKGPAASALSASAASIPLPSSPPQRRKKDDLRSSLSGSRGGTYNMPGATRGSAFTELQLTHVKNFCEELIRDPSYIRDRKLQFFRDFLLDWEMVENGM